jgi:ubiquinone/menaquinone biosynthesis C-methylase UbiE
MTTAPEELQRQYYERTASNYDSAHVSDEEPEHNEALAVIELLCQRFHFSSFLDVGAGTGRGVRFLHDRGHEVRGVEPVPALIEQAENKGCPHGSIVQGSGYSLPFADNSFDVVFECGVLHHVARPEQAIQEMMRVASWAIFLSDSNRFGQGPRMARYLKLLLYKANLWNAARYLQTKGKMYTISEGDGLAYSYSVYDSYQQLAGWANQMLLFPTKTSDCCADKSWLHPLTTSSHLLLCAIKNSPVHPHGNLPHAS